MVRCSPDKIIYDEFRGEYVCTETGEVLEERVPDYGPEWRSFDHASRSRAPLIRSRRRGVLDLVEAVIAGVDAFGIKADVSADTRRKVVNVATSVTAVPYVRPEGMDWVRGTIYAGLVGMGFHEDAVKAGFEGKGRLARLVQDLRKSLTRAKVQAVFRGVVDYADVEGVMFRRSKGALLVTMPSPEAFPRVFKAVKGRLAGVNVFVRLPPCLRVSPALAGKIFGVMPRPDGRVVVRNALATAVIRPTAVNMYGGPFQPETLVRFFVPRALWAATEV